MAVYPLSNWNCAPRTGRFLEYAPETEEQHLKLTLAKLTNPVLSWRSDDLQLRKASSRTGLWRGKLVSRGHSCPKGPRGFHSMWDLRMYHVVPPQWHHQLYELTASGLMIVGGLRLQRQSHYQVMAWHSILTVHTLLNYHPMKEGWSPVGSHDRSFSDFPLQGPSMTHVLL